MPEILNDPTVRAKTKHFSLHSYSDGGGSSGVPEYLKNGAAGQSLWVTEFNVWCPGCDTGSKGSYDWNYTRGTAKYLMSHLLNGASAAFVWEGTTASTLITVIIGVIGDYSPWTISTRLLRPIPLVSIFSPSPRSPNGFALELNASQSAARPNHSRLCSPSTISMKARSQLWE